MSDKTIPDGNVPWMPPDEAEAYARSACSRFEGMDEVPWRADYDALLAEDWPWYDGPEWNRWRLAAYVAWASAPVPQRWPETMQELAQVLGWSSARQIRKYRARYPELDRFVSEAVLDPLFERRARVLAALADVAEERDYKANKDRELFLKLTGDYRPAQDVTVRQESISADEMAAAQEKAEEEAEDWAAGRFGGDDDVAKGMGKSSGTIKREHAKYLAEYGESSPDDWTEPE